MNATSSVSEIIENWTDAQRRQAVTEIIRELRVTEKAPFYIEGIGWLMPAQLKTELVVLDDSTPWLREMRRRAETPEDSFVIAEFEIPDDELDSI